MARGCTRTRSRRACAANCPPAPERAMQAARPSSTVAADAPSTRALWVMLLALTTGFALSQAYRTVATIMATQLQQEFALSPQQLGTFAAMFHFSFGALQLLMGIGIDLHGVRRTVLVA